MHVAGDIRREPILDVAAVQRLAAFVGAECVLRRVAGAAMARPFDQIGAAIPFRALVRIGPEGAGLEEHQVPAAHEDAMIERPGQLAACADAFDRAAACRGRRGSP